MKLTELFDGQWPRTALFDLDGTLVDSAPDLSAATDQMLRTLGRNPAGEARVREWVGNGASVLVRRALAGQFDHSQDRETDDITFQQALDLFFTAYASLNGRRATVYEGVEDFLAALSEQGCKLAVVTNKPQVFAGPLLEMMGLDHWFDLAIGGDTLPLKKPDPTPLLHAIQTLKGDPESTLMVGDSVNDIAAAHSAKLRVVAVRYGYTYGTPVDDLGADFVVDSLAELL
ncbi:phosphoglycolate phosphatase [Marinobacter caseinilyticus]|uniref:phosphoglycolate phosphatase n=1 Tax=Marinobacter caseinilyticus TaxID=2692195 RepID=UPI0014086721|nr:phosphoglycolate phosphatase [Marinobacter caseinilyticus]